MCSFKLEGKKECVSDRPGYWTDKPVNHEDKRSRNTGKIDETGEKAREMLLWCYRSNPPKAFLPKSKKHISCACSICCCIKFHIHCDEMTLRKFESKHTWPFKKNSSDKAIVGQQRKNHSAKEKKKISCVWEREKEREGEKHINVFRSGLKVLYLIAMYSGVNWRLLRKKKRDGK